MIYFGRFRVMSWSDALTLYKFKTQNDLKVVRHGYGNPAGDLSRSPLHTSNCDSCFSECLFSEKPLQRRSRKMNESVNVTHYENCLKLHNLIITINKSLGPIKLNGLLPDFTAGNLI